MLDSVFVEVQPRPLRNLNLAIAEGAKFLPARPRKLTVPCNSYRNLPLWPRAKYRLAAACPEMRHLRSTSHSIIVANYAVENVAEVAA
jgi:hypothetical protein